MTLAELETAKAASLKEIAAAADAAAVEALRVEYVGRNGSIPALIKAMKDVPKEERPAFGKAVQAWKAEVEAALDDSNLSKLLDAIETLKETTQLIVISHQRRTMEQADVLYGVSMQADGVSHVVSQRLDKATGKVVDA